MNIQLKSNGLKPTKIALILSAILSTASSPAFSSQDSYVIDQSTASDNRTINVPSGSDISYIDVSVDDGLVIVDDNTSVTSIGTYPDDTLVSYEGYFIKSTAGLVDLGNHFTLNYDYDEGQILIDGKDIKEISTESLFDKVSIVFQDVVLFNQSVMENIRLGKQDASDKEVKRAAKLANCTDFIEKMDKGFDTVIGENGAELSGGERQRLSIARAFLKDAPILILDEITASLDVDNEKKIQESLNNLIKDKTVIIISHRMKSIENADKIVVLENGKVESEGKHEELLQKSKVYKNLIVKTKMAEEFIY